MYGLVLVWVLVVVLVGVKTDNTAYQALVLVWLGCGNRISQGRMLILAIACFLVPSILLDAHAFLP